MGNNYINVKWRAPLIRKIKKRIKSSLVYQKLQFRDFNLYNTTYGKKALLCYINRPFRTTSGIQKHSNRRQARIIGETLSKLGYDIDVLNYEYTGEIDYSKYSLIFGFGVPFEKSFQYGASPLKIYYATGPHFTQRNMAEVIRLRNLFRRKGVFLNPQRQKGYPEIVSATMADAIICTGNEWTISTFKKYFDGPIYRTPIGIHKHFPAKVLSRDWGLANKNFLWIGGDGLVFKGLDLCIEAFVKTPGLELHICGNEEPEFMKIYKQIIDGCDNIIFHGHVDVSSDTFKTIAEKCGYIIFPGSAEAGCGSVLTAMSTGLIPIVTKETSINIEGFGHEIKDLSISNIVALINRVACEPSESCARRSDESSNYVDKYHSFEKYENALLESLRSIIPD